eukprot:TRINITY_DN1756_c0_g1_i1.p1 TRINITY_DN1756_c0_g1~~TRINITY_DN1756_c0_g1_i1.p1  ORF type:complete len:209 (+),score=41.85 TRINITY_DN1756_c0_g1_i1:534-1160(+)
MSENPEHSSTPDSGGTSAFHKEYEAIRKRLVRAYTRKAQWENRILLCRRELEVVINRINGSLSSEQRLDYEQLSPPDAQLTSPRRTTGIVSIKQISDLQGSLDGAKLRINALLNENQMLREKVSDRRQDLTNQVTRLDLIIGDLVQLQFKQQQLAKLDEASSFDVAAGDWQDGNEEDDRQTPDTEVQAPKAADVVMHIEEDEKDLQTR